MHAAYMAEPPTEVQVAADGPEVHAMVALEPTLVQDPPLAEEPPVQAPSAKVPWRGVSCGGVHFI